jgi:transposase
MDSESLRLMLAQGLSLAEIGKRFDRHESTVAYWVQKHGLEAVNRDKHAARGGLTREELEPLVSAGISTRQIAEQLELSATTVRHWLREYGLVTRRAAIRRGLITQPKRAMLECDHHGLTEFQLRAKGGYRCLRCRSEAVSRRRRRVKELLVQEAGGACQACGYRGCIGALHFHHIDPASKRFSLSHRGVARSLARARAEAEKCILLCGNCHAEIEAGMRSLS